MKKTLSVLILLISSLYSFSQNDEIKTIQGESIKCKVDSITPTHVFYHFPNENDDIFISKIVIDYIKYSSGRVKKIENKFKYPINEKEVYLEECFKNLPDSIHPIYKLNYCLKTYRTIESKLSYKDVIELNLTNKNYPNNKFLLDFFTDLYLIHNNELSNSNSFTNYQTLIKDITHKVCLCIENNQKIKPNLSQISLDCKKSISLKLINDRKFTTDVLYKVINDTSSNFVGKIIGGNILEDIERTLFDNCQTYLSGKIKERNFKHNKIQNYNHDSLINELNTLKKNNLLNDKYYHERGLLYFFLGDYNQSISDFNMSLEINPKNYIVFYFKYMLYDYINDIDNSIKYLKEFMNTSKIKLNSELFLLEKLRK